MLSKETIDKLQQIPTWGDFSFFKKQISPPEEEFDDEDSILEIEYSDEMDLMSSPEPFEILMRYEDVNS